LNTDKGKDSRRK